jgi:hypothetical protein
MANHVQWSLNFSSINEEAREYFLEMQKRVRKDNTYKWFGDLWVDNKEGSPTYEESEKYEWTLDNIGPKWCYIDDMDDTYISGHSAWVQPEEGLNWLLSEIAKYDPNFVATFQYDDEMPNFFGAAVYQGEECLTNEEWDWDELIKECCKKFPEEIGGKYNHEDGEWADEKSEDFYRDVMYEVMNDLQDDEVSYGMQYIEE